MSGEPTVRVWTIYTHIFYGFLKEQIYLFFFIIFFNFTISYFILFLIDLGIADDYWWFLCFSSRLLLSCYIVSVNFCYWNSILIVYLFFLFFFFLLFTFFFDAFLSHFLFIRLFCFGKLILYCRSLSFFCG